MSKPRKGRISKNKQLILEKGGYTDDILDDIEQNDTSDSDDTYDRYKKDKKYIDKVISIAENNDDIDVNGILDEVEENKNNQLKRKKSHYKLPKGNFFSPSNEITDEQRNSQRKIAHWCRPFFYEPKATYSLDENLSLQLTIDFPVGYKDDSYYDKGHKDRSIFDAQEEEKIKKQFITKMAKAIYPKPNLNFFSYHRFLYYYHHPELQELLLHDNRSLNYFHNHLLYTKTDYKEDVTLSLPTYINYNNLDLSQKDHNTIHQSLLEKQQDETISHLNCFASLFNVKEIDINQNGDMVMTFENNVQARSFIQCFGNEEHTKDRLFQVFNHDKEYTDAFYDRCKPIFECNSCYIPRLRRITDNTAYFDSYDAANFMHEIYRSATNKKINLFHKPVCNRQLSEHDINDFQSIDLLKRVYVTKSIIHQDGLINKSMSDQDVVQLKKLIDGIDADLNKMNKDINEMNKDNSKLHKPHYNKSAVYKSAAVNIANKRKYKGKTAADFKSLIDELKGNISSIHDLIEGLICELHHKDINTTNTRKLEAFYKTNIAHKTPATNVKSPNGKTILDGNTENSKLNQANQQVYNVISDICTKYLDDGSNYQGR